MEGGMGKVSVDYYGKRRGKANAGILYKCDANAHAKLYKTSTSRTSNNRRNGKRFTFFPLQFPLYSLCVNQVMQSKCK